MGRGREEALAHLFQEHYPGLVRLALLLTSDRAAAEDIAQEASAPGGRGAAFTQRERRPPT